MLHCAFVAPAVKRTAIRRPPIVKAPGVPEPAENYVRPSVNVLVDAPGFTLGVAFSHPKEIQGFRNDGSIIRRRHRHHLTCVQVRIVR